MNEQAQSRVLQSANTVWQPGQVSRADRERMNGHRGAIVWFTGLSGAGKSTLAHQVEAQLHALQCRTIVLDGDNVRHGLCGDLGFSDADRTENIRRVGEMSKLFLQVGVIVLAAFISPFRADREKVRALVDAQDFFEVHCACNLKVCEERDVKGLYKKARSGEIKEFTGITSPYEAPLRPELRIDTGTLSLGDSAAAVLALLREHKVIP